MSASPTERLRSELVYKGRQGQLSARFIVIPEDRLMEHLPRRLGANRALDDAVRLICASEREEALRAHGLTLKSLQDSLINVPSTEVVGAATLLQMHAFFQDASQSTWMVHAKGVIGMLKARGPHAVESELDKCLLQAQLGNITLAALREGKPCFLEFPAWNEKIKALGRREEGGKQPFPGWETSLIAIGVHVPGLIYRFEAVQSQDLDRHERCGISKDQLELELSEARDELKAVLDKVPQAETRAEGGTIERIQPALLLSANLYLIMFDYMLESIGGPQLSNVDRQVHIFRLRVMRGLHRRLSELDTVALQRNVAMHRMTVDRMLKAANVACTMQPGAMSLVIDEVYQLLKRPDNGL